MNYSKLRNLLYDTVCMNNQFISKDFCMVNREYLLKYVDKNLINYCDVMFKKDAIGLKSVIISIASLMAFIVVKKMFVRGVSTNSYLFLIYPFLIFTNLNFIFSSSSKGLFYDFHIRWCYKIKRNVTMSNRFGYHFAYIGLESAKEDCKVIRIVSLDYLKGGKKLKLYNPRLYLVNNTNYTSVIIDYLYNKDKKDLEWLKNEIFLDVQKEYLNFLTRQQAINNLIEI